MSENLDVFDKFVSMSVTSSLKMGRCEADAFNRACTAYSKSFWALRESGFSFGSRFVHEFDELFVMMPECVVVDVQACLWVRCDIPGPPDGVRGWTQIPRGSKRTELKWWTISDEDIVASMAAVTDDAPEWLGPLGLRYPVLAVTGDCNDEFEWMVI